MTLALDRQQLRLQLLRHEGVRLAAYRCPAGHLTIGVGHNLDANPATVVLGRRLTQVGETITAAEASQLLDADLDACLGELARVFPWLVDLSEPRQRVIADMAFNLGLPRLRGFRRMLAAVIQGRWDDAAAEMLDSAWATQVGQRAQTLAAMMREGH